MDKFLKATYKTAKRVVIAIVGTTVVLIGIIMIVLPGPAMIVIPAGLGILSLEFVWARRWLKMLKDKAQSTMDSVRGKSKSPEENASKYKSNGHGAHQGADSDSRSPDDN